MKISFLATTAIFLLSSALLRCTPNHYGDSSRGAAAQPTENQDSINRVRNKLIAEARGRNYDDASEMIRNITSNLAKNISPNSYESATYDVDSTNAAYDTDTKTYVVSFKSDWFAFVHGALIDSAKSRHTLWGKLTLYGTGEKRWKVDSVNEALNEASKFNNDMENFARLMDELNKASKDNDNTQNGN